VPCSSKALVRLTATRTAWSCLDAIAKFHRLGATAHCHLSRKAEVGRRFIIAGNGDPETA
jgi:hypothetical protein